MGHDINKEIDQAADKMEKSVKTPREILLDTIRELGPEGIRAKLPSLEKSEKELLLSVLEEMKKAVSMDDAYAAKYVQGKVDDTKIQEDKADDDQDEKLVKPEAAKMSQQGTPTDGWEGQVIKAKEPKMSKEAAKDKIMEMEETEHGTKDPKKLVQAEKKEHGVKKCMKKGEAPFKKVKSGKKDEIKEGLKEIKKSVEEQLKEFGVEATPELVKSEMKRLLAEEAQDGDAPEMNEKTRANKENVAALNLAADSKEAQKKVNDDKQGMKKANWAGEQDLLKALSGGRNHHFSMEEYFEDVLKAHNEKPSEDLKKSEKKDDLNELIAKGQDASWDEINCDRLVKANVGKQRGRIVKSFEDNEIAQALGLTPEEAKKILGE